ncbi:metallophosphoesterase [Microbacterium sp. KUDC0406]|uniref:metallophosphoesterase n=1 Tax=Microbacterium sp. KUDC0406 TaxID=2909588 RepID=UPI001F34E2BA|nr:metallophosphoesterase [Microbacterium sp. KUDC0406]UJP09931.1 metallophosphoesterase [Microbacterium sp. KUDC0406]
MGAGQKVFAVVGDVHGRWEQMAAQLEIARGFLDRPEDLEIIFQVGDAEPTLGEEQLQQVYAKPDRHQLGDFHLVASGEVVLPAPFYFIGGNHEPWRTLDRNGGVIRGGPPLAPGVHFLGRSGVVEVAGLRVAFLSGIRRVSGLLLRTADERAALTDVREHGYFVQDEIDVLLEAGQVDILLAHDWPAGSDFVHKTSVVGDEAIATALRLLRPAAAFHGHLHRRDDFFIDDIPVFARGCWGQGVPEWVSLFRIDLATGEVTPFHHVR